MAYDLARIVRDTEHSLALKPSEYATQLELFLSDDEKILSEFLSYERDEKPHYIRHKNWEILVGKPEKYSRPKKFMEKQRQDFPETEMKIRKMINDEFIRKIGISQEVVNIFGDLPNMCYKMLDMETNLYESIVAYAKQIGVERGIKPRDIVKSTEGRNEIYLRTFQSKERFELYNNTYIQVEMTALGIIYKILEELEPKIRSVEKIPFLGWIASRKLKKVMKKVPPKAVANSFLREAVLYNSRQAEKIFENNVQNPNIMNAEIIE